MRLQIAIPEEHVSAPVLNGALEAVTRLNQQMIKAGDTPTSEQLIAAGARWKPEPPGQEHFDHGGEIAKRGWGDCDDWAPLRAATLRVTGEDPGAKAVVRKSGPKRWHATVIRSDGTEDDPSVDAGMHSHAKRVGARGAWVPLMQPAVHGVGGSFIATPHLALRPVADRMGRIESWQARTDLPWHGWEPSATNPQDLAMVTLHQSPVSSQAIVGALNGAFNLGLVNGADPEHLKYVAALADMCEGMPWEEVAQRYGAQHATAAGAIVGSFFGKALKGLKKVAKGALKVATPALSLVPGGGLASAALKMASPSLKKSVAKAQHAPPQLRPALAVQQPVQRAAPPAPGAPVPGGGANWLPFPYPLPYPVPGWSGAPGPGEAWPRG